MSLFWPCVRNASQCSSIEWCQYYYRGMRRRAMPRSQRHGCGAVACQGLQTSSRVGEENWPNSSGTTTNGLCRQQISAAADSRIELAFSGNPARGGRADVLSEGHVG